jgi:cholesterol oxidase
MGVKDTFGMTPVGVFFGPDNTKTPGAEVDDPFFGGMVPAGAAAWSAANA